MRVLHFLFCIFLFLFWCFGFCVQSFKSLRMRYLRSCEQGRTKGFRAQGPGLRAQDPGLRTQDSDLRSSSARGAFCAYLSIQQYSRCAVSGIGFLLSGFGFGAALRVYREREVPEHDVVLPDRHERAQLQFRRLPRTLDVRLPEPSMPSGHHPIPHS